MTDPRKTDARSSTRVGSRTSPASTLVRTGARMVILCVVAGLSLISAWRWHQAGANAPLRVADLDGPSAVLVVQTGDCPDRRAALSRWVGEFGLAARAGGITLLAADVGGPGREVADTPATGSGPLPLLAPAEAKRAARALLRAGAEGTPALLLLDATGHPILAATFTEAGPGPRLRLAAAMMEALIPARDPAPRDPHLDEVGLWNPSPGF